MVERLLGRVLNRATSVSALQTILVLLNPVAAGMIRDAVEFPLLQLVAQITL